MKGCYVYCTDKPLADYLRRRLLPSATLSPLVDDASSNVVLARVSNEGRQSGHPAVPVIELRFAASAFSDSQATEECARDWVALPEGRKYEPGLFIAQVVGESMNRRIPNGSWCLFRANPVGSREGKIVVVQHRQISDAETGGRYTIKRYSSEKIAADEGGWKHRRITLSPESTLPQFKPIVIELDEDQGEFTVIAELIEVLTN
jgi:hypothetical protein